MRLTARSGAALAIVVLLLSPAATRAGDSGDFEKARKVDTIAEYQNFLKKHPKSPFVAQASARIEVLEWQQAARVGDAASKEVASAVQGTFASIAVAPNALHVVTMSHDSTDPATPFRLLVDGRESARVSMLAPGRVYWAPDSQAFGWWERTKDGWLARVTGVDGKLLSSSLPYAGLAGNKTGNRNLSISGSFTSSSGSTTLIQYFGADGREYVGGEPAKGSEVANASMAVAQGGAAMAFFVGEYGEKGVASWHLARGQQRVGSFPEVWFPGLAVGPRGDAALFSVSRDIEGRTVWFVTDGEKEYGPYRSCTRVCFSSDGVHRAWGAQVEDNWYTFIDGQQAAGPFDGISSCAFLESGQLGLLAKRRGETYVVAGGKETRVPPAEYVAGPISSPDGEHVAGGTVDTSYPWPAQVVVDGHQLLGPFKPLTSRDGNRTHLDIHGVLALAWFKDADGRAAIRAVVLRNDKIVIIEKRP